MTTGTVKWFDKSKKYGFIAPDDGSKDVFVHLTAIENAGLTELTEGQTVSFDIVNNRGKDAADNIKLL
ncbi:MAG: cold-shock protein [Rickettsiaceae bacterium]|nr:cold-shock protein [Rickettsiaceae bacterium]